MKLEHVVTSKRIDGANVAIVRSAWYPELVGSLTTTCRTILLDHAKCKNVDVHTVPGCLELPLACRTIIESSHPTPDAFILLGVLLKGETMHFEYILNQFTDLCGRVMWEFDVPILVDVLPVNSLAEAEARCGNDASNKGIEAANAAIEMIAWRKRFQRVETRRREER